MTWFVVDKADYAAQRAEIGAAYRALMGGAYPAMSLSRSVCSNRARWSRSK